MHVKISYYIHGSKLLCCLLSVEIFFCTEEEFFVLTFQEEEGSAISLTVRHTFIVRWIWSVGGLLALSAAAADCLEWVFICHTLFFCALCIFRFSKRFRDRLVDWTLRICMLEIAELSFLSFIHFSLFAELTVARTYDCSVHTTFFFCFSAIDLFLRPLSALWTCCVDKEFLFPTFARASSNVFYVIYLSMLLPCAYVQMYTRSSIRTRRSRMCGEINEKKN